MIFKNAEVDHKGITPDGRYNLAQFYIYTPSEHHINDEEYPLEVHFVFEDSGK